MTASIIALAAAIAASTYAGPDLRLSIDVTDTTHRVVSVHERLKVTPGELVLHYPQWIQGHHAPTGRVSELAGLRVFSNGVPVTWRRDLTDPFSFRIRVPAGASQLDMEFQLLSALDRQQGNTFSSPHMVRIQWNEVSLYPAGRPMAQLSVEAEITAPGGWQVASSLDTAAKDATHVRFAPTDYETLLDSPAYAARYLGRYVVDPRSIAPVAINVIAEQERDTLISSEQLSSLAEAFEQARRLFGSQPYRHYDFLVVLSNHLSFQGLEHRQSSEDSLPLDYFTDTEREVTNRNLLVHEYIHAWNGKLHRPQGLVKADANTPLNCDLLWVYEGLTKYLDKVLSVRSGLWSPALGRDAFAWNFADLDNESGRTWRPLQDTVVQPIIGEAPQWQDWARSEDYYEEGALLWLEIDTRIRSMTQGKRSLDDFIRRFFGRDPDKRVVPYSFDDIVRSLNDVAPGDWATLLTTRLEQTTAAVPKDGLIRGGYTLVYTSQPSEWVNRLERRNKVLLLDFSLGATVAEAGVVSSVRWGSPAYLAGILPGDRITHVSSQAFTVELLRAAMAATSTSAGHGVDLTIDGADGRRTVRVEGLSGLRYPHLVPVEGQPDVLDGIFSPIAPGAAAPH